MTSKDELEAQDNRSLDAEYLMSPWPNYPHWHIWSSAGQGWKVHQNVDRDFPIYFFTSYGSCTKEQTIDLYQLFPQDQILFRENVTVFAQVEQWYKFIGPCTMELWLKLVNEANEEIQECGKYKSHNQFSEAQNQWKLEEETFCINLYGIRYIKFYHGATCNDNLEDEEEQKRVGTCFAKASLKITLDFEHLASLKKGNSRAKKSNKLL